MKQNSKTKNQENKGKERKGKERKGKRAWKKERKDLWFDWFASQKGKR